MAQPRGHLDRLVGPLASAALLLAPPSADDVRRRRGPDHELKWLTSQVSMKCTIERWTPNVPLPLSRCVMDRMNNPNPLLADRFSPHVTEPSARAPGAGARVRCRFAKGSDSG